jgi:DNA-binding MarR family transcriptional regulator
LSAARPQLVPLDAETRVHERPSDHRLELRLWLRMLTCSTMIEAEIRRRLRAVFGVTLPRFDLMAQLEKAPDGLTLGQLSRRMMVSNGNVTGLVERLSRDGFLERRTNAADGRSALVALTEAGRAAFAQMARAHGDWIAELFRDLSDAEIEALIGLLGRSKVSVSSVAGASSRR